MSALAFLTSSFYYFERAGVTDVQTIMDDFESEVLAVNSPVWTSPSAGLYKCPVDGDGRFYDVLLTRVDQQKLEWRVRDQNAVIICTRRINLSATYTWRVGIFTGEYHCHIDADSEGAAVETLRAGMVNCAPEGDGVHTHYVYGNGFRTNADTADSNSTVLHEFMIDNAAAAVTTRLGVYGGASSPVFAGLTVDGEKIYRPVELYAKPTGEATYKYFAGRKYQHLLGLSALTTWTRVTAPIDTAMSALFQVTGIPVSGSFGVRQLIRVA